MPACCAASTTRPTGVVVGAHVAADVQLGLRLHGGDLHQQLPQRLASGRRVSNHHMAPGVHRDDHVLLLGVALLVLLARQGHRRSCCSPPGW
jgi:hypothetical protein